jgi:hypothetical protein
VVTGPNDFDMAIALEKCSFVATNAVYEEFFDATPAEAQTPEMASERAKRDDAENGS